MEFFSDIVKYIESTLMALGMFFYIAFLLTVISSIFMIGTGRSLTEGFYDGIHRQNNSRATGQQGLGGPQLPYAVVENNNLEFREPAPITVATTTTLGF
jgi:hypothetical protein